MRRRDSGMGRRTIGAGYSTPPALPPSRTARQTTQNRHREWLHRPERSTLRARARRELRGLRLGCWCDQPGPCHGHNIL